VDVATYANPVALVLTGSTICASPGGNGTITSSTSVSGVNYQLFTAANAVVGSAVAGTGSALSWSSLPSGTGYYVVATNATTSCVSRSSNAVDVATNANPVAGTITGPSSVCMGNTLSLTSHATGTPVLSYLWNSSNTAAATVSNSGAVTPVAAGVTNITYTVTDGSSTSCTATSGALLVTVNALPSGNLPVSGSTTLCMGTGTNVTVSLSESGVNYQLRNALGNVNIGTPVSGNGGSIDLPTGNLAASTTFNVLATNANTGCAVQLVQTKTVTVTSTVTIANFSPTTSIRCQGAGTETTTTTATNNTVAIVYSLDASSLAFTGNSINATTGAVTYSAGWSGIATITATVTGCNGSVSTTHVATTTPTVNIAAFSPATSTRCRGAGTETRTTTATNNTAAIVYSLDATTLAFPGNSIDATTGAVTYAAGWSGITTITATVTGCNGPVSTIHVVTTTPIVAITAFSPASIIRCQSAGSIKTTTTAINNISAIVYSLDAFTATFVGNIINSATGTVIFSAGWSGTTTIKASVEGCNGSATTTQTVTTLPFKKPVITGKTTVCAGETGSLYTVAGGDGHTYNWSVIGGTIASGAGTNHISVSWGSNAFGTVDVTESIAVGGCTLSADQIRVAIKALPVLTEAYSNSRCDAGTVTLEAAISEGTISWYTSATSKIPLKVGSTFTTPVLYSTTAYYVAGTSNTCTSATRTIVTATVSISPVAPVVGTIIQPDCASQFGSVTLTGLPANGRWTLLKTPGSATNTGTGISAKISGLQTGTHNFIVTNDLGCKSVASSNVVINDQPLRPNAPLSNVATNVSQTSYTANWSSSPTSIGYLLDVSTDPGFNSFVLGYTDKDVGNVTTFSVAGLKSNTSYYYRIKAYNLCGASESSYTIALKSKVDPPNAPTANPATNQQQISFTANWSTSPAAVGYRLDVATDAGFTNYVSGFANKDVSNVTNFMVSGLSANTSYYYRLRAYNDGGTSSNSAIIVTTTLPNVPIAPIANSASAIIQSSFTANWSGSANATGYRLDVSTDFSFSTFLTGFNNKDVGNITTLSVPGLNARTLYYYRIRAYNTGGTSGNSNTVTVRTLSVQPAAPNGLTSSSCNNLVTLKWRKGVSPYFQRYRIYGGTVNNPTMKIDSTSTSISDTTKTISGLMHGQNYNFRVTTVNDDGTESVYSNQTSSIVKSGLVPKIAIKWSDVLICSNVGDSISNYQWYMGNNLIPGATGQYYPTNKQAGSYFVATIDIFGCKNNSAPIIVFGTKSLTVYPNPASVNFTLQLENVNSGRAVISMINSAGLKVLEMQTDTSDEDLIRQITVNNLEDGFYIVQVILNNNEMYYTKMVVKK
jgi:hypothetical protein